MGPPRSSDYPPGSEIYILEQNWMKSCKLSHDLFCLCNDFRQHFLPGPGCFTPVHGEGDGAAAGGDDVGDDILVTFDLGDPGTGAEDG